MGIADIYASIWQTKATNKNNLQVTQSNNDFQERMSRTAHQREVKDLKSAGLNPILSARSSGAPQPSSAAAKVEPYHIPKQDFLAKQTQVQQIKLLEAQSAKTRAEAINAQLQRPYNEAVSDLYRSVAGVPLATANVVGKTAGTLASGFGLYKAGQAITRMRKSKVLSKSEPKPLTNLQKQKLLRKLHELKTNYRNKFSLRPGEYIDRRTGEIKSRSTSSSLRSRAFAPDRDLGKAFRRSYKTFGRFGRFRR